VSILDYLGFGGQPKPADSDPEMTATVRKLVRELDHLEPERARFIAAFAYVLARVAHADLEISDDETRAMERIIAEHGGIPEAQSILVVQMAKNQNLLFGGTDNFLVTRELNRIASREQKFAVLECLFAVSAADESISTAEDSVVRQVATELQLEHGDFIAVRRRFREHLAVLKKRKDRSG
jgi:uncharacterized tellurite resistance protein B-like protein